MAIILLKFFTYLFGTDYFICYLCIQKSSKRGFIYKFIEILDILGR